MASDLQAASNRWAERSLRPTPLGVSKWETEAQDVSNGVASWAGQFGKGLRDIGASPSDRYIEKYVSGQATAAAARKYSGGVEKAVREDKWTKGFLNGVSR